MNKIKKIEMKSIIVIIITFVSIPVVLFTLVIHFAHNSFMEEIGRYDSPGGTYTVIAYRTNGGATTSFGLECYLHKNRVWSGLDRKIYTEYPEFGDEVVWEDDDTVIINDTRIEDVTKDKEHIYHTKPAPTEQNH